MTEAEYTEVGQPTVVLAQTVKGRGFSEVEDHPDWHGKPFPPEMAERAITELGGIRDLVLRGPRPTGKVATEAAVPAQDRTMPPSSEAATAAEPISYALGRQIATRKAYGDALVALGSRDHRIVALDGEVSNSTYAVEFARAYPDRYFEMFIAEQQMVGAATGLAVRGLSRSRPPSPPSSPGLTTSSGWARSPGSTCAWSAPTPASRSAPTAPRKWRWKTSP